MRAYIVTTIIGVFGVDEKNKIITFKPFAKNPAEIAEKTKLSEIEMIDEETQVRDELGKKGYRIFIFGYRKTGVKHVEPNNQAENFIKDNIRKLALDYKFIKDQIEFNQILTKINLELTKVKIKRAIERDSFIIQVNGAIEEIDKSVNILSERLREWYGLHFPEMDRIIDKHEKYAKIIERFGDRKNIEDPELSLIKEKSMGVDITEDDMKTIQLFAGRILEFYKLRESLSKYLEKVLKEVAPNFTEIAGHMLSAKLIAKAGGLDKLAKMASSTIQLLGSEKALFRFLHSKKKTGSPKYGILFSHPLIQNSPQQHRGKIARLIAAKLSIAAKMDYYSKEYRGDKMKLELQEKIKEILSSK